MQLNAGPQHGERLNQASAVTHGDNNDYTDYVMQLYIYTLQRRHRSEALLFNRLKTCVTCYFVAVIKLYANFGFQGLIFAGGGLGP